jgi:hypothetical protein
VKRSYGWIGKNDVSSIPTWNLEQVREREKSNAGSPDSGEVVSRTSMPSKVAERPWVLCVY